MIRTEIPEWRIIDEPTWDAVQKLIALKADEAGDRGHVSPGPSAKYMLSGLARHKDCGQPIGVQNKVVMMNGGGQSDNLANKDYLYNNIPVVSNEVGVGAVHGGEVARAARMVEGHLGALVAVPAAARGSLQATAAP